MLAMPDGVRLEVLRLPAATTATNNNNPPLLFIHGSYHAAWCWAEHFMPFFSNAGYETIAISIRGQGHSDRPEGMKISGDLQSLADDLGAVIASLWPSHVDKDTNGQNTRPPPVLVGHSFGGLLVEKYVSQLGTTPARPPIAGVALICSVPPSGNKEIVVRITKANFIESMKITWGFIARSFAKNIDDCRFLFFSPDLPRSDLERYQAKLADASPIRLLDLSKLVRELPLPPLPPAAASLPAFVAGGEADKVVDPPAVVETAAYFGVEPVMWPNTAHDCQLDTRWEVAAQSLLRWLENTYSTST